ncbi:keratinocyte differentiation factor 1 isoform X1 [Micropterus salmoides]|uniref:keratinocyte differentiation factor 1 n=1 Tax=Micropterus dolomieu TaxID=147949 RepID=UPI0018ED3AA1|nr:keratinocyte differentiation factor 1 isoform X1 [Micropterus salmoides]XP_045901299.1 keratinocyte differentiation factor 1 [Micropterus dolomieu]
MPGHNTGAPQASHHHKHHSTGAEKYRQTRTISRESTASQDSYKDPHGEHLHEHHTGQLRYSENKYGRSRGHPRNGTGRGSETIGFIPGSADSTPTGRHDCGSCASMGWSGCKAFICCVLTCGFYGSREPCLPANESSTDHPPKAGIEPHPPNGISVTNPTCGIPLESRKSPKVSKLPTSDSFRYPDVRIAGQTVRYPAPAPKRTRMPGKGESQRPISNTSLLSREDYDLDDLSDTGTDIDSLITKKLLELYALHQIDQLAKCTSDSSFSRKTNEISELIYSIAQDYNLEEQEAECKLVHGVIRISTRKGKRNKSHQSLGQRPNGRSDGTLPDSGNETMTNTFMSSDFPEVKVSEQTPSDELARKMRHYSGRTYYSSPSTGYSPHHHDTERDSSGTPLIL